MGKSPPKLERFRRIIHPYKLLIIKDFRRRGLCRRKSLTINEIYLLTIKKLMVLWIYDTKTKKLLGDGGSSYPLCDWTTLHHLV